MSTKARLDIKTANKIVEFLNDLLEYDRAAVAALVAGRVICNQKMADHPTVQVHSQKDGFHIGLLGILNGLCGIKKNGYGLIVAHFGNDPKSSFNRLKKFTVDPTIPK